MTIGSLNLLYNLSGSQCPRKGLNPRIFQCDVKQYSHKAKVYLFIWGFNVTFNTVQVISRRVVGRAEETST